MRTSLTVRSGFATVTPRVAAEKKSTVSRQLFLLLPSSTLKRPLLPDLGEAAAIMGVEMTTQADLDAIIDIERRYKLGAMRHCAAGDSDLTVSVSAELRHLRIAELDAGDGRNRKINNKYCLWGLDL